MNGQPEPQSVVFVVDDDPSIGNVLQLLFRSVGLRAEVYASVAEWQAPENADRAVGDRGQQTAVFDSGRTCKSPELIPQLNCFEIGFN